MNTMAIPAGIAELEDEMIALRRRIHAQPELAYEEFATGTWSPSACRSGATPCIAGWAKPALSAN